MRIVPSIGFNTAEYAAVLAAFSASATVAADAGEAPFNDEASPRRIWDRITPELPRAPISEPWLIASQVGTISGAAASSSLTTASRVRDMFVPVSPSGTG